MQELRAISATARLLGDRRLRPHGQLPNNQLALKCPRCDSLNTKFCYYNNYNLSQPRHFCKNCRRYWTKGGVLRNVPVGGGCRKSKRSSKPKAGRQSSIGKRVQSHSSSESSNNNNNGDVSSSGIIAATASGATHSSSSGRCGLFQISENENFNLRNLKSLGVDDDRPGNLLSFPGEFGGLVNLMDNNPENNSNPQQQLQEQQHHQQLSSYDVDDGSDTASYSQYLQSQSTAGVHDWGFGQTHHGIRDEKIDDQTVRVDDLLQNRGNTDGLVTLDWNQTVENYHQGFFDLPSTVDHHHQSYWNHSTPTVEHPTHWSDHTNNHSLFLR